MGKELAIRILVIEIAIVLSLAGIYLMASGENSKQKQTGLTFIEGKADEFFVDMLNISANGTGTYDYNWNPSYFCKETDCELGYLKISGFVRAESAGNASIFVRMTGQNYNYTLFSGELAGNETIYLDDNCNETCSLIGFYDKSYDLVFETDGNIQFEISNVSYQWIKTESYSINVQLKDRYGAFQEGDIEFAKGDAVFRVSSGIGSIRLGKGKYNMKISPFQSLITGIYVNELNVKANTKEFARIDYMTGGEGLMQERAAGYSIDLEPLEFSKAFVNISAVGDELWKCYDWKFEEGKCEHARWIKLMNITAGDEYRINLTREDIGLNEVGGIFFDSFETGNFSAGGWTSSGDGLPWTILKKKSYCAFGAFCAVGRPCDKKETINGSIYCYEKYYNRTSYMKTAVSTEGYSDIVVSYYRRDMKLDYYDVTELCTVEWFDGTNWNLLDSEILNLKDKRYAFRNYSLPSEAGNNPNFALRFGISTDKKDEKCFIDNVRVAGTSAAAALRVELLSPTGMNNQPQGRVFNVSVNVQCVGNANASCGSVSGMLRYNSTSNFPETGINSGGYTVPFYTIQANPLSCGLVNFTKPCNLTWSVNATGAIGDSYKIDARIYSDNLSIIPKNTDYTIIKIIAPTFGIILSNPLFNVQFPEFAPGTENNPALNNSDNGYYITCDYYGGRCNVSIRANSDMISPIDNFAIGNVSWNQSNDYSGKKSLTFNYEIIKEALLHTANQSIYFWIDIPSKQNPGSYRSNFTIQGMPN